MRQKIFLRKAVIFFLLLSSGIVTSAYSRPFPRKVHRILFLGNSITYAGQYVTDIEAWFVTHYPERHYEFINVGLPSETVSGLSEEGHADGRFPRPDLHERLARVLAATKPDFVFASYGMNDGIYQPFNQDHFEKFKEGINWLHREIVNAGIPIIHLTPPVFDEKNGGHEGYSEVLDRYSEWLLGQRDAAKWKVADVHFPMKKFLEDHRKADATFAFAKDGVHPDASGHWIMAKQILLYLGEKNVAHIESIEDGIEVQKNGKEILRLISLRQEMMKDAWLTATKHTRPEMKVGLPLEEAKEKAAATAKEINALLHARGDNDKR